MVGLSGLAGLVNVVATGLLPGLAFVLALCGSLVVLAGLRGLRS